MPPAIERVTMVSVDRRALEGMMLITTGTATSSVGEPSVASSPVCETCPKLNWNVCAAGKSMDDFYNIARGSLLPRLFIKRSSFWKDS